MYLLRTRRQTSLVVQWLRICLAIKGTQVWSLAGELRSNMPWGNWVHIPQLESAHAAITGAHIIWSPHNLEPMSGNEKSLHPTMKISHATTKIWHSQIKKINKERIRREANWYEKSYTKIWMTHNFIFLEVKIYLLSKYLIGRMPHSSVTGS